MERDGKSKRNEKEIVKRLYKEEREKLEKMELWKIEERVELYTVKAEILKSLQAKIASLPLDKDSGNIMRWYQEDLSMFPKVCQDRGEKFSKVSSDKKAEYEYQKVLVEHLAEYLKKNYELIPGKNIEGKLQFEAIDKKANKEIKS